LWLHVQGDALARAQECIASRGPRCDVFSRESAVTDLHVVCSRSCARPRAAADNQARHFAQSHFQSTARLLHRSVGALGLKKGGVRTAPRQHHHTSRSWNTRDYRHFGCCLRALETFFSRILWMAQVFRFGLSPWTLVWLRCRVEHNDHHRVVRAPNRPGSDIRQAAQPQIASGPPTSSTSALVTVMPLHRGTAAIPARRLRRCGELPKCS